MIYSVRHITIFRYEPAVRESVMEVRMMPRNEGGQRCLNFQLNLDPSANVMEYRDFMGNTVHHFDIAPRHSQIKITARALVEVQSRQEPPASQTGSWDDLDSLLASADHSEMLMPSHFVRSSPSLHYLAREIHCERRATPLQLLTEVNQAIYDSFDYVPNSTKVDSPIDEALQTRQGVCQDFAHIMIALGRDLRIPCRYVSGYLFHGKEDRALDGATHAWVEALIPGHGWVGFDPTNNLITGERHIRVALGRDYSDVPPTRGVYKGSADSDLSVTVTVLPSELPLPAEVAPSFVVRTRPILVHSVPRQDQEQQQQQ